MQKSRPAEKLSALLRAPSSAAAGRAAPTSAATATGGLDTQTRHLHKTALAMLAEEAHTGPAGGWRRTGAAVAGGSLRIERRHG